MKDRPGSHAGLRAGEAFMVLSGPVVLRVYGETALGGRRMCVCVCEGGGALQQLFA